MSKPYKHAGTWMIDTADLLKMDDSVTGGNNVHIVVKGICVSNEKGEVISDGQEYFFEDHTCPWNFLRFSIKVNGDSDPHGIFRWVSSVPLPDNFDDMESSEQFNLFEQTHEG